MKRRIIQQKSAYTVTLPVDWARAHNINAKDEVEVQEEADTLVIRTEKKPKTEEINLKLEKSTPDYYRIMIENHYLKGYDKLNVTFEDKKAIKYNFIKLTSPSTSKTRWLPPGQVLIENY